MRHRLLEIIIDCSEPDKPEGCALVTLLGANILHIKTHAAPGPCKTATCPAECDYLS